MTKYGIDYLGGQNYINTIVDHHPPGFAAGFLVKASGWKSGLKAARALAKTGKCPVMRIHGIWHDNHHFTEKDIAPAVKIAKRVAKFQAAYPNIKIMYSPWLEHGAKNKLFKKCAKACKKELPKKVKIVNSGPKRLRGIDEVHHSSPIWGKYIFSFDGEDMFESNVEATKKNHKKSIYFFGWIPECNGKKYLHETTPRPDRKHWLKAAHIKKMKQQLS